MRQSLKTVPKISNVLYKLYGLKLPLFDFTFKQTIKKIITKIEGGELYSRTLRRIMKEYYGVEIGMYTHHGCFEPGAVEPCTRIGRYCSIARNVRIINVNHPSEFKSTSGIFWQPKMGLCKKDIEWIPKTIEHDVWIGYGAIILPRVTHIATGAVVAAGAVVSMNVPPYAVVVGNPARIVRYRFSKETIEKLLASKWWEKDIEELKPHIKEFQQPYEQMYHGTKAKIEGKTQTGERLGSSIADKPVEADIDQQTSTPWTNREKES